MILLHCLERTPDIDQSLELIGPEYDVPEIQLDPVMEYRSISILRELPKVANGNTIKTYFEHPF